MIHTHRIAARCLGLIVIILAGSSSISRAQIVQFSPTADSTQKVTISGYIDTYFCYDFASPATFNIPYFVSQNRHNEVNVNLAFLKFTFTSARARATFTPGFGTFMNSNFSGEANTLQHVLEANVGVKLFSGKDIWIDAGVLPSPYTNESEISFDQLTLTRSFAPEYVPYYQSGVRLTLPVTSQFTAYLFLLNGWQVISDVNNPLAFGSQFEFAPTDELKLDLNTYYGNEGTPLIPNNGIRSFLDFYTTYSHSPVTLTLSAYVGNQQRTDSLGNSNNLVWWQTNAAVKYAIADMHAVNARVEYFSDPNSVMITPINGGVGFKAASVSAGYDFAPTPTVLFRMEGRYFISPDTVFENSKDRHVMVTGGLTLKF